MSRIVKATDEYKYQNTATISGYIVAKHSVKNGHVFTISVANKNDTAKREYINVYFEGALGKYYDEKFREHTKVIVNGVAQGIILKNRNSVRIFGLNMANRKYLKREFVDFRKVHIRGKISETVVINENVLLVYVSTNVHKTFKNPNRKPETAIFENDFISTTPIAIYRNFEGGHDASLVAQELTKGTWINVTGRINTVRKTRKDGSQITEQNLVAYEIFRIGEIQRS